MKKNRILVILLVLLVATSLFAEGQKEAASTKLWPKTQPVVYVASEPVVVLIPLFVRLSQRWRSILGGKPSMW